MKKLLSKQKNIGIALILFSVILTSVPSVKVFADLIDETIQEESEETAVIIEAEEKDIDNLILEMNPDIPEERLKEILNPVITPGDYSFNLNAKTGYIPFRIEAFDEELYLPEGNELTIYAEASESYWEKFSSSYYREQLNASEKKLYDRLYQYCMIYLTTEVDMDLNWIPLDGLSFNGVNFEKTFMTFANSNPQFYFVLSTARSGYINGKYSLVFGTLDRFVNGKERMLYTNQIQTKIEEWISEINEQKTSYDKIRKIYQIIAANVYYDHDFSNSPNHQSCATAILYGKTVCAGYSELFALLAKGVGFETICVTSENHEWNQILIGDKWYIIDLTWDDMDDYRICTYNYFLISDNTLKNKDSEGAHVPEEYFSGIRPTCPSDYSLSDIEKDPPAHTHWYSGTWIKDEEYHWRECINSGCESPIAKTDYEKHVRELRDEKAATMTEEGYTGDAYCKTCKMLLEKGHSIPKIDPPTPQPTYLFRYSRPDGGDWLLTCNDEEINNLVNAGWHNDGAVGVVGNGVKVIRFYNKYTGDRMYTANEAEAQNYRDAERFGWVEEGLAFRAGNNTPVIRYAAPNLTHLWSVSSEEQRILDAAASQGWVKEGIAFYL